MVGRRIVYGVALLAALALQIFYDGYLAQLHLELTPSASQLVQGESGQWQIAAHTRSFLPVARLTMVVTLENRLTGNRQRQRLKTSGLSRGMARTLPMDTSHCGQLTCQLHRVRALDLLGLFAFPVSTPPGEGPGFAGPLRLSRLHSRSRPRPGPPPACPHRGPAPPASDARRG